MHLSYFFPLLLGLGLPLASAYERIPANDTAPCPHPDDIVYSPFTPWFNFYSGGKRSSFCWKAAICTLEPADEARKQQFGATALVMGLLPLTLRDIAWPERRIVLVSAPLPRLAAVVVRGLGLEPTVKREMMTWGEDDVHRWMTWVRGSWFAGFARQSKSAMRMLLAVCFAALMVTYGALAVVELYSKGSALGCTYPVFAVTWCITGVLPAIVHTLFESWRRRKDVNGQTKTGRPSAVQGVDEAWPVQLSWAIYYTAGTLIYTSIMAVTVLELFVWVAIQLCVTAASKLLALYICISLRDPVEDDATLDLSAATENGGPLKADR
ncbi:uncharacterized protein CIMG_03813 [Coccidioides immitis RS]|uniref:Uncharacterized protein n=2 Tax=Coccidioides TaxID=5500 RepID=J3KC60_COCIM|nr:uncharacterized protein CIMG_03813 [Coccidioides immitis RS]EAS32789.3 hypothetical protein CIMG_03813 [Coccidioides immitis RS]TPX19794.1 hypothetical protein DIZ76_017586 [Coccidioides immitis]